MARLAEHARELAKTAERDADRAEAELWSIRMEAYGVIGHFLRTDLSAVGTVHLGSERLGVGMFAQSER
jgi:hypothetical protein